MKSKRAIQIFVSLILFISFIVMPNLIVSAAEKKAPAIIPGVKMPKQLIIKGRTSPGSGFDWSVGPLIYNIWTEFPRMPVTHLPGSAKAGVDRIESGEAQMGATTFPHAWDAYFGLKAFKGARAKKIRWAYSFPPASAIGWIVRADSDIYKVEDLLGKRVSSATAGGVTGLYALPLILKNHGLSYEKLQVVLSHMSQWEKPSNCWLLVNWMPQ
jgi:TRAP-type uncharacterized transport system substrate-binding protein